MKLTNDEIAKEIEYLRHAEENDAADMILALKARAEAAEKALNDSLKEAIKICGKYLFPEEIAEAIRTLKEAKP